MPVDWSQYPKNWSEIRDRIRARADGHCEWCRVPHGEYVLRVPHSLDWYVEADTNHMNSTDADALGLYEARLVRVVCTVAHLGADKPDGSPGDKHDKMDNRDENLAYLCQQCHLEYDRADHIANRRRNQRLARVEAGQMPLSMDLI